MYTLTANGRSRAMKLAGSNNPEAAILGLLIGHKDYPGNIIEGLEVNEIAGELNMDERKTEVLLDKLEQRGLVKSD